MFVLNIVKTKNCSSYVPLFIHPSHQELQRRAPSTGRRTEPRTSSWSWRTAWRSERGTNQKSLSKSRKCSASTKQPTARRWNKSSRACWMGLPNGRQRSASQVSKMFFLFYLLEVSYVVIHWSKFVILVYMNKIDMLLIIYRMFGI